MSSRCLAGLFLLFVFFEPIIRAHGQENSTSPPADVSFTISTKTDATVYHVGEIIPLELTFTSSSSKSYQINMAAYDRSGRMAYEEFALQPEAGWTDPLKDYFSSFAGFFGGGLTTFKTLSNAPIVISLELNEWVRFDSPGHYSVRVTTHRVSRINRQSPDTFANGGQALVSNELELAIVPATREWQDETLRNALDVIGHYPANAKPGPQPAETLRAAMKTLRYLGNTAAAQEMARRFNDDSGSDYGFGLIGSPERDTATKAMQEQLVDPDKPISNNFISILSVLSVPSDQAPEVKRTLRQNAFDRIREQLWEAIPQKRGQAKSVSLMTALTSGGTGAIPKGALLALAEGFDDLPLQQQAELLEYRWDLIRGPEMLPVLRKYARQYQDFPALRESPAFTSIGLSGAALQRWYELEPEEARPAVIEEILRPKPRFDAKILGILPDDSLPDVEQSLVERLASTSNYEIAANLASLVERYATKAVLPQMISVVDANVGRWACAVQTPALAYLLRTDPAAARPRIEAALAARGQGYTACNHSLLVDVANLERNKVLEDLAIRSLGDDDAEVAANGADFLGKYGSSDAEQSLWGRFEVWNRQWQGHESELKFVFGEPDPNRGQRALGENLAQSLAAGQAWLADAAKLQRVAQLSLGLAHGQEASRDIEEWNHTPYAVTCYSGTGRHCNVLQYRDLSVEMLKEKITQFPEGSGFVWTDNMQPKQTDQEDVFRDLQKFAADHGMTLRKPN
jgi:hypothetical protein